MFTSQLRQRIKAITVDAGLALVVDISAPLEVVDISAPLEVVTCMLDAAMNCHKPSGLW
jgi:hypothetical protein